MVSDGKDDMGRQDSSLLRLTRLFLEQNMTDDNGVSFLYDNISSSSHISDH